MNLKELIEEILANSFMYEMSPAKKIDQATTKILKAIEELTSTNNKSHKTAREAKKHIDSL